MVKKDTAFSLSDEVLKEMDETRGNIPRSTWLENTLRKRFLMPTYQRA